MSKKKWRSFGAEFKTDLMLSVLTGKKSQAEVCLTI